MSYYKTAYDTASCDPDHAKLENIKPIVRALCQALGLVVLKTECRGYGSSDETFEVVTEAVAAERHAAYERDSR